MKRILFSAIVLIILVPVTQGQVGINNTNPQAALDVTGTVRITVTNQAAITTNNISGVDPLGNYREITPGDNITLSSNRLSTTDPFDFSFGSITLNSNTNDNVDLFLQPGEVNHFKNIIRIYSTVGAINITGFEAGYDGQHVWIYAQNDTVDLLPNDAGSLVINRIEMNDKNAMDQWEILEMVYDGMRNLWIIKQWHK